MTASFMLHAWNSFHNGVDQGFRLMRHQPHRRNDHTNRRWLMVWAELFSSTVANGGLVYCLARKSVGPRRAAWSPARHRKKIRAPRSESRTPLKKAPAHGKGSHLRKCARRRARSSRRRTSKRRFAGPGRCKPPSDTVRPTRPRGWHRNGQRAG